MSAGGEAREDDPSSAAVSGGGSERLVKSGAGLAIACVVIVVFVLMATYLTSVLFGLALAYFLLPLEKFFERLLGRVSNRKTPRSETEEAVLALKASVLAIGSSAFALVMALSIAALIALPAISSTGSKIKSWASSNEIVQGIEKQLKKEFVVGGRKIAIGAKEAEAKGEATPASQLQAQQSAADAMPAKKNRMESALTWVFEWIGERFSGKESNQFLTTLALDNGQSLAVALADAAMLLGGFVFDLLLTFFFLFYFLQKMALFAKRSEKLGHDGSYGRWLVDGIFESHWMPETDAASKLEAAQVIDRIVSMLHSWVRGYLSIIIVESVLYVSAFILFKVPFPVPLGLLAGCTILLPFIGPLASAALTLCFCLAAGEGGSLFTILGVIGTYLTIHGALEQLFLYPRLVGEAIGLSELETIIVVLLGGLFAGIAGMIFAVPAASVLKMLVPAVYRLLFNKKANAIQPRNSTS